MTNELPTCAVIENLGQTENKIDFSASLGSFDMPRYWSHATFQGSNVEYSAQGSSHQYTLERFAPSCMSC